MLLLEDDGETTDQLAVEESTLPEDGRRVDAVVTVELEADDVIGCTYEGSETRDRSDHAQRRFDELSQRPPTTEDDPETS